MMHHRTEHIYPGFTKYPLDFDLQHSPGMLHTCIHHFWALEPPESDPHNHPFPFTSTVTRGSYVEHIYHPVGSNGEYWIEEVLRRQGDRFRVEADTIHKLVALPDGECFTFAVLEPKVQDWKQFNFDKSKLIKIVRLP